MDELALGLDDDGAGDDELTELRRAVDELSLGYRVWRPVTTRGGFYVRRLRSSPPWHAWAHNAAGIVSAVKAREGITP